MISEAAACGCPVVLVITDYIKQFNISALDTVVQVSENDIDIHHIPTLDKAKIDKYFKTTFIESLESIQQFIKITQAAAETYTEKSKEPARMLERGISAFQADDFEQAIPIFSELLDKLPENPLPPAYLSFICARQGLAREAADFIEKSVQIAPDRVDLKAALGESFLKAGQPDLAAGYLNDVVMNRPDLLAAYPALAQSLHLTRQSEMAVSLLQSAASVPSSAQANIQSVLLEILAQQGDIEKFTDASLRFSRGLADNLLAARNLSRFEFSGERLLDTLGRIQAQVAETMDASSFPNALPQAETECAEPTPRSADAPLKIAFLVGDFAREQRLGRLAALLRYLPPEKFMTLLLVHDLQCTHNDYAHFCLLLADQHLFTYDMGDAVAQGKIEAAAPDILIDLDAYGPEERLAVFLNARVKHKFLWGETPMPPLSPDCKALTGARLAESSALPCVALPEMGECCDFPEISIAARTRADAHPALGCLTPAIRISREGWQLFAEALKLHPDSPFLINLRDLGEAAQDFIGAQLTRAGVAAERLRFVHAHTAEDFCRLWQEIDLGLAPPVDAGGLALPTCLWMGKPYLTLASPLPWARRPAALLEAVGATEWIAETPEDYIERARQIPLAPNPAFRARIEAIGLNNPLAFAQGFAASITAMLRDDALTSFS
jgi:predicted O-linked N-acetylglucosamine transferase (SPINDLY family)